MSTVVGRWGLGDSWDQVLIIEYWYEIVVIVCVEKAWRSNADRLYIVGGDFADVMCTEKEIWQKWRV